MFKPSIDFLLTVKGRASFVVSFCYCLYSTVMSAPCSLMTTCWERSDLLFLFTRPRSAISNMSCNRCESDCRPRGHASSIPVQSHTFVEIDYEINSTVILLLLLNHSRWIVVRTSEIMCTKYWLAACSSLPRNKVWLGELTFSP